MNDWIFDISLCENSINQSINQNICLGVSGLFSGSDNDIRGPPLATHCSISFFFGSRILDYFSTKMKTLAGTILEIEILLDLAVANLSG